METELLLPWSEYCTIASSRPALPTYYPKKFIEVILRYSRPAKYLEIRHGNVLKRFLPVNFAT